MESCMLRSLIVCLLFVAAPVVTAQSAAPVGNGPQLELTAEASREVANDLMTATMAIDATDASPVTLASLLNRTTADALRVAGEFNEVRARSGGSQTYPVFDRQNKQTGWRGRAEVRLESRNFQQMAQLVAKLQATMQLGGIAFSVSPEVRRQMENELINEAVAAFRTRADIASKAVGARGYRIRRLAIHTGGSGPVPRPMARMSPAMADAVSAPAFEGGTSQVQVSAQGMVEAE
jgi:predicted secreted protein